MAFSNARGAEAEGNSASASITHGLTINSGNLVVAWINSNSTTSMSADAGGTTWNEIVDETPSPETAQQGMYWKVAGGSEPSSYSWTVGNAQWYIILKVFDSLTDAVISSSAQTHRQATKNTNLVCGAANGAVIADGDVSLIFGGKDNRTPADTYGTVDNSYTGVIGDHNSQDGAGAHRIYVTGTTFSGDITFTATQLSDNTYSAHVSFAESSGTVEAAHRLTLLGVG